MTATPGLHHVTAIAGDPQRNVEFYAGTLGLRLVKRTVNFDDPGTYHLYFGTRRGDPGTILTFFPWPGGLRGRVGSGQVGTSTFSVPQGSLSFWEPRLAAAGAGPQRFSRFGERGLAFRDPDGLPLELLEPSRTDDRAPWGEGPVAAEHAVRGFHSVTLFESRPEGTASLLTGPMGFVAAEATGDRHRFLCGDGRPGSIVDVLVTRAPQGVVSVGTVHHVALRARDAAEQHAQREALAAAGARVTSVIDRRYFRSIYFHEPGGALFEVATDPPGFTLDEPEDALGLRLALPEWLEPRRAELERTLPPLRLPPAASGVRA